MSSEHGAKKGKDVNKVYEKKLRDYKKYKKNSLLFIAKFSHSGSIHNERTSPALFVLFAETRVFRR